MLDHEDGERIFKVKGPGGEGRRGNGEKGAP